MLAKTRAAGVKRQPSKPNLRHDWRRNFALYVSITETASRTTLWLNVWLESYHQKMRYGWARATTAISVETPNTQTDSWQPIESERPIMSKIKTRFTFDSCQFQYIIPPLHHPVSPIVNGGMHLTICVMSTWPVKLTFSKPPPCCGLDHATKLLE